MELMRTGETTEQYTEGRYYEVISYVTNHPFYTVRDDKNNIDVVSINDGFREIKEEKQRKIFSVGDVVVCDQVGHFVHLVLGEHYTVTKADQGTVQINGCFYYPSIMFSLVTKNEDKEKQEGVGTKLDQGKLRYDLIAPESLKDFARVLSWGAFKYSDNNWKKVKDPRERYYAALMRHLEAFRLGELENKEEHNGKKFTGHHLSSVLCCAYFLLQMDIEAEEYIIPDDIFDKDGN